VANPSSKEQWLARLRAALGDGSFVKLTLGGPCDRKDAPQNIFVRQVELKDGLRLSFVYRYATRDVTKNFTSEEAVALLGDLIGAAFHQAHLFTTQSTVELKMRDGRGGRLIEHKSARMAPAPLTHDQPKQRLIDPRVGWLRALGVTTAGAKVAKGMEAKFRQINKFVEVLEHLLADAGARPSPNAETCESPAASELASAQFGPRVPAPGDGRTPSATDGLAVVDMGCGKGYLTFAAYDWLTKSGWNNATVRGIEARSELATLCNRVARESRFDGLRFETGHIADATLDRAEVLIALHACDTATDDAIAKGVQAGASLIIVSPCCHKELRPQLQPPSALAGALRHGILLERHAEFLTDALRAALLEWAGYDTKVFEFVSTEHTAKNLMIAATKRRARWDRRTPTQREPVVLQRAASEYGAPLEGERGFDEQSRRVRELAALYGVRAQRLASHLGFNLQHGDATE
jgi:hypothetical protein